MPPPLHFLTDLKPRGDARLMALNLRRTPNAQHTHSGMPDRDGAPEQVSNHKESKQ